MPEHSQQVFAQQNQPESSGYTLIRMLFYTFLMVACPLSSYFASKNLLLKPVFRLDEDSSIVPAAIIAIVVVHVILGLFVYAAFHEKVAGKEKGE